MHPTSMFSLTPAIIITTIAVLLLLLRRRRRHPRTTTNYCPYSYPIIGNLLPFILNRHRFLDWATDLLASSPSLTIQVPVPFSISSGVCTANPSVLHHLLLSNSPNYIKGTRFSSVLSDLLGRGIFIADGLLWSLQRKIASHEFTTRSLKSFASDAVRFETRHRLLPRLAAAAHYGDVIDLQDLFRRFGFDNICRVAFGTDPAALSADSAERCEQDPFFSAFDDAVEISAARFFAPVPWVWKVKRLLNVGSERRLRRAIEIVDDYALKIITLREKEASNSNKNQDLLSRFMRALEQDDVADKRSFLRDIVKSFILAGKDSTSSALSWFFWLVSRDPIRESRIIEEVSAIEEGDELEYEELKGLNYLHAAITEALRLYPPVAINSTVAVAEDVLPDGTRVGKGWFADYSAYAMGRMEEIWGKDCREFSPERWLDEKGRFVGTEAVRFPAFHAGPRACLGREMAYVQMKAVVAAVMREFVVEPVGAKAVAAAPECELSLTMRMKGGFPVRIKRRAVKEGTCDLVLQI